MIDDIDQLIQEYETDMDACDIILSFVPRQGWRIEKGGKIMHDCLMEEHACFYVQGYLDGYATKEAENGG